MTTAFAPMSPAGIGMAPQYVPQPQFAPPAAPFAPQQAQFAPQQVQQFPQPGIGTERYLITEARITVPARHGEPVLHASVPAPFRYVQTPLSPIALDAVQRAFSQGQPVYVHVMPYATGPVIVSFEIEVRHR